MRLSRIVLVSMAPLYADFHLFFYFVLFLVLFCLFTSQDLFHHSSTLSMKWLMVNKEYNLKWKPYFNLFFFFHLLIF